MIKREGLLIDANDAESDAFEHIVIVSCFQLLSMV